MTKAEVIAKIASETSLEREDVSKALEAFFIVVKDTLAGGGNVYVRGFGSFVVKRRKEKIGRIISKNTSLLIPAHNVPTFKASKTFVERVKQSSLIPEAPDTTPED